MKGRCTCREVAYELTAAPLFVHCCHCRWCQRETGSAFALNAMIEASEVRLLAGAPVVVDTPSESGKGQKISRCPACHVAVWSVYPGAGPKFLFVRVGTLENPDACPPDIHIFTESRQPWFGIPPGRPVMERYYDRAEHWPAESLERYRRARAAS